MNGLSSQTPNQFILSGDNPPLGEGRVGPKGRYLVLLHEKCPKNYKSYMAAMIIYWL